MSDTSGKDGYHPRDVGGLVVRWTGPPLLPLFYNRSRPEFSPAWSMADVRQLASGPLRKAEDVVLANMVRTIAWLASGLLFLAIYIVTAFVRRWTGTWDNPAVVGLMTVTVVLSMFAMGTSLPSALRWGVAWSRMDRIDREFSGSDPIQHLHGVVLGHRGLLPQRGRGWRPSRWLRLRLPSNWDLLFGLALSACIAPDLFENITDVPR